jgi:hypothetical protein
MPYSSGESRAALVRASQHEGAHVGFLHTHEIAVYRVCVDDAGGGATLFDDSATTLRAMRHAYHVDRVQARTHLTTVIAGMMAGALVHDEPPSGPDAAFIQAITDKWALVDSRRSIAAMLPLATAWAQRWVRFRRGGIYAFALELQHCRALSGAALTQALASAFPPKTSTMRRPPYVY